VELQGLAGGDGVEGDFLDDEVEGDLIGLAVFNEEAGTVYVDFADEDFDFAMALVFTGLLDGLLRLIPWVRIFGREMDVEAGDLDTVDEHGRLEELAPVIGVEGEVVDLDEGVAAVEVVGIELEAGAGDFETADEVDVEGVELDAAVETGAEGFDDFGFEHGADAVQEDIGGDERGDDEDGEDGGGPEKNEHEGAVTAALGGSNGFVHVSAQC